MGLKSRERDHSNNSFVNNQSGKLIFPVTARDSNPVIKVKSAREFMTNFDK
jgi:hypothetical protein